MLPVLTSKCHLLFYKSVKRELTNVYDCTTGHGQPSLYIPTETTAAKKTSNLHSSCPELKKNQLQQQPKNCLTKAVKGDNLAS